MPIKVLIVNTSDHDNHENIYPLSNLFKTPKLSHKLPTISISHANYRQAQSRYLKDSPDLLLFSGRTYADSPATVDESIKWYSWIKNINTPTFTICGSYQRWTLSEGGQLNKGNPENGLIKTNLLHQNDSLFQSYSRPHTYILNHHRYFIDETQLPHNLKILGYTKNGLSVVKHRTKPIYGFQGHPEQSFFLGASQKESLAKEFSLLIFSELLDACSVNKSVLIDNLPIKSTQ